MFRKWILAAVVLVALPLASARADFHIGVGIGLPAHRPHYWHPVPHPRPFLGGYLAPAPVYVAPPPRVYVQPVPTPVYVQPTPAPVYVQPVPVQPVAPPPPPVPGY